MTVLEASDRIGGRVLDTTMSGCGCISMGAMFVTGVINNPFTLLVKQQPIKSDFKLIPINEDHCDLMLERGVAADSEVDKRVEIDYNRTLDKLSEWRSVSSDDASLLGVCCVYM